MNKTDVVTAYRVPIEDSPVDVLVLFYDNNFYSFGATCRSSKSVWREIKDRLEDLSTCNEMDSEIIPHFYEAFYADGD